MLYTGPNCQLSVFAHVALAWQYYLPVVRTEQNTVILLCICGYFIRRQYIYYLLIVFIMLIFCF